MCVHPCEYMDTGIGTDKSVQSHPHAHTHERERTSQSTRVLFYFVCLLAFHTIKDLICIRARTSKYIQNSSKVRHMATSSSVVGSVRCSWDRCPRLCSKFEQIAAHGHEFVCGWERCVRGTDVHAFGLRLCEIPVRVVAHVLVAAKKHRVHKCGCISFEYREQLVRAKWAYRLW
jgi:hypothetical protein